MKTTRNNIRKLREGRGMTQAELAEEMGVVENAVSKWETGCADPTVDRLVKLASFFGVTTDYVLGLSRDRFDADEYLQRCLADAEYVVSAEGADGMWRGKWFGTSEQALDYIENYVDGELYSVRKLVPVDLPAFLDGHPAQLAGYVRAWDAPREPVVIQPSHVRAMRIALSECASDRRDMRDKCMERAVGAMEDDDAAACKSAFEQAVGYGDERRAFEDALEALEAYGDAAGIVPWD